MAISTRLVWRTTVVVTVFSAVSAVGGAAAIFLTDGLGMPTTMLAGSPFSSFVLPGIILLIVVGGTQTLAVVLQLRRRFSTLAWTAFAGFTMIIWILVETVLIGGFSVLQALYFATGTLQLVLTLALLGIVSWIPRVEFEARRPRVRVPRPRPPLAG